MKTIYLNAKYNNQVETIDQFSESEFSSYSEFIKEVKRCVNEYRLAGIPVYRSQRCTNDWKNR